MASSSSSATASISRSLNSAVQQQQRRLSMSSNGSAPPHHTLHPEEFRPFRVAQIQPYNYNTSLYRIEVPEMEKFPTAAFVRLDFSKDGEPDIPHRAYTPINLPQNGAKSPFMELIVKHYPDGKFTVPLKERIQPGDDIWMIGPKVKFLWTQNQVQELYLLAGGTGIAPMIQLAQKILSNPEDKTQIHILFGNKTEKDILLREQLEEMSSTGQLKVQHILEDAPENWDGLTGLMTEEVLRDFLPSPESLKEAGTSYRICTCGPKNFTLYLAGTKGVSPEYMGLLKDMNYPVENVFKF